MPVRHYEVDARLQGRRRWLLSGLTVLPFPGGQFEVQADPASLLQSKSLMWQLGAWPGAEVSAGLILSSLQRSWFYGGIEMWKNSTFLMRSKNVCCVIVREELRE